MDSFFETVTLETFLFKVVSYKFRAEAFDLRSKFNLFIS